MASSFDSCSADASAEASELLGVFATAMPDPTTSDLALVLTSGAERRGPNHDAAAFPWQAPPHPGRASVRADVGQARPGMPDPCKEAEGADRFKDDHANIGLGWARDCEHDAHGGEKAGHG
jgi:hypothetical protein